MALSTSMSSSQIGLRNDVGPVLYKQSHNFCMFASSCIENRRFLPSIREATMVQKESHHCEVAS